MSISSSLTNTWRSSLETVLTITVYSKPDCPQCRMTKRFLDARGAVYDTVDVTEDVDAYRAVRALGYRAAPVVCIGNGTFNDHWSGFQPDRLTEAVAAQQEAA